MITIEDNEYPDYVGIGIRYAQLVADEKIPSCRYMILAAQRFLDMYQQAITMKGEYYWSDEHAVEVCAFLEQLTHVKGVLAKEKLVLEPWQIWILIAIYGFRWSDSGYRVVAIVQLEVTRKSGKSLLAAGIALYEMCVNANFGDDLFVIAPTAAQALKVMEPINKMVDNDVDLKNYYGIQTWKERIDIGLTESYGQILSSKGQHQDGHDPKTVIADEFHSLPASIFNVMKSSQGARPESFFVEIGSAGYNAFGVGWDERNLAIEVIEGKRDRPDIFAAIYTIDPEDMGNWRSERVIRKANPNYGISLDKRKIKQEIEGIYTNPRNKNETLRTRFNVWGLGESKLISRDDWDLCADETLDMSEFSDCKAAISLDLASRNDMVAAVIEFDLGDDYVFFARHYVPENGPWREDEEVRDIYQGWHDEGWLTFTPGSYHTYDDVYDHIIEWIKENNVEVVAIDDREANAMMASLSKAGHPVVSFRKNATNYSEPTKDIMARSVGSNKGLRHNGNPILAWNVENVIGGWNTAEQVLPKKISEHSNMKIDGFDGMVMTHACLMEHIDLGKVHKANPMAERGVRIIGD